jgi:arylsulfatase A-like enzyme
MRADHVGFLGYHRPTTPFLDSLASQGLVFTNAIAAGSPTYYSVPAILASRYPLALGRDLIGLAPEERTITSVLKESGFQTAAFLAANPYLSPRFGYDQGFDVFHDFLGENGEFRAQPPQETPNRGSLRNRTNRTLARTCHSLPGAGPVYDELYFQYCQKIVASGDQSFDSLRKFPSADVIVDHAITWLNQNSSRPFFLWLHLMDPHSPYFPKQQALEKMGDEISAADARYLNSYWARGDVSARRLEKKRDRVIALYDAGIRWADYQIRRLSEKLVDLNLWDRCALAVTADHGEQFLDHGQRFHPPLKLNDKLIHVPLLLRTPNYPGRKFESPFSLIDLAPTLLDIVNIPLPASFRGQSCSEHSTSKSLANDQMWDRAVVSECVRGCTNPFYAANREGPRILAVRARNFKLVIDFGTMSEELFDLAADPAESRALPEDAEPLVRRRLLESAKQHLTESRRPESAESRLYSQLRNLSQEWMEPPASRPN